jgi:D-tyrosyl-tRNA(Tyr) deacylase
VIAVVQRVRSASVIVKGDNVGSIGVGYLVFAGFGTEDTAEDCRVMATKIVGLRLFNDAEGRMNRDLKQVGGAILAVSQFTLLADTKKGRRPSFLNAAPPAVAANLMDQFLEELRKAGLPVETGRFQTHMEITLLNDGPVTLVMDTSTWRK